MSSTGKGRDGAAAQDTLSARGRILDVAYQLFSEYGIRAIGVDRIVAEAHVAKMTLYRYFPSKDQLVIEFLQERSRRWTHGWLSACIERVAPEPHDRLLGLFDALEEWFQDPGYEGCSFIRTLHEIHDGPVHDATVRQMETVRAMIAEHAELAGARDPQALSYQIQNLMLGAMVSALRGDLAAGRRARESAALALAAAR